ncbi:MAG: hypothetical protein AB8G77_10065 [Rhodothermales bacterium]
MSLGVAVKALVIWLAILVVAVVNGLLREKLFIPNLGAIPGMVLSGVLLSCLILAVAYVFLPWLGARFPAQLMLIGVGWLVLTLTFEFSFGFFRGKTLSELLEAYAFEGGNIWPVVLLVTAVSPWLAAKFRGWI